jgi:hypothetical protein
MGREIYRVPLDFDFPLDKTWTGYLMPEELASETPCPEDCHGFSKRANYLKQLWYGYVPFSPKDTGSTPFLSTHPVILARAKRNVEEAPDYYGTSPYAVSREANRLAEHYNNGWLHHLTQEDVDVLVAEGRLHDFTHTFSPETRWTKIEPPVHPTAAQVNEWSLQGMGHDGINAYVVIKARCEREGEAYECHVCNGEGSFEAYEGQRAEKEAWERTKPPEGEGWQLWQTVSEGGPISPVFETPEELARWMASPAYTWGASKHETISYESALSFVKSGWAPSFVSTPEHGVESGENFVGRTEPEQDEKCVQMTKGEDA